MRRLDVVLKDGFVQVGVQDAYNKTRVGFVVHPESNALKLVLVVDRELMIEMGNFLRRNPGIPYIEWPLVDASNLKEAILRYEAEKSDVGVGGR